MDRRAFLALVGAYASAGMLPTRKVSPVLPPPLVSHYLTDQNEWYVKDYVEGRDMGWMVTQEVLDNDLYGNIAIGNQSEGIYLNG